MRISNAISLLLMSAVAFTSCRSTRNLTSPSNTPPATAKKTTNPAKRQFLNNIEITPGSVEKPTTSISKKPEQNQRSNTPVTPQASTNETIAYTNLEKANALQIKYAILMDVVVEKLNNIPLLEVIDKWWGTRYCMGGATDNCLDCSGFTQILMRDVYKQMIPRTSQDQYNACEKIDLEEMREGDLVFFNTGGKDISHVGIYLLNNKFVHAATSGGVMISDITEKYWQNKFRGAGRMPK